MHFLNLTKYRLQHIMALVLLFGVTAFQAAFANQSSGQVVGEAFGLTSSELLYSETHCDTNEYASEVIYQHRDGSLIAHKFLDYQSGALTPSVIQHNIQSDEKIEVSFDRKAVSMSVSTTGDRVQENRHLVSDIMSKPVVIDAGFDGFIRENWGQLVGGDTLEFQFPLAYRSSMVSLRVQPSQCSYEADKDQCFTLEPSNWFYRMLSSPIELGYDTEQRRLARYRGLSNINDESGNGLIVDIKYSYQEDTAAVCGSNGLLFSDNTISWNRTGNHQP